MTEGDTITPEMIEGWLKMLREADGLPKALVVPPGFDYGTLPSELGPGLNGIKVIVSPHCPAGEAFLITDPPKTPPPIKLEHRIVVLRPGAIVNLDVVP